MKKLLLSFLALGIGVTSMAQRANVSSDLFNKSVKVNSEMIKDQTVLRPVAENQFTKAATTPTETQIGQTMYDLQSNSMVNNRIYQYEDGTMASVWTMGLEGEPNFAGRGTGYAYFDGTTWGNMPTERVEDERTGWPSYAPLGENGEIVVAHLSSGLKISTRETKGTGEWNYETFMGPDEVPGIAWPRMTTSGENHNTVHIIANSYDPYEGQTRALLYSRSTDGGETWADENIILDGLGSDYYTEINADDYIMASNGDNVAIMISSPWMDLVVMKSEDNGETWNKTVVWEHPYPMFDWETTITTDTIWGPDGSGSIAIDDNGKVHIAFGLGRVIHEEVGTSYNYFPYTDGIIYWNEDMPAFENENQHYALKYENIPDENYAGYCPDINGNGEWDFTDDLLAYRSIGISTMPTLSIGGDGNIYIAYASLREDLDNGTNNYKHIFGIANSFGEWTAPTDLTDDVLHMFDECIYPQMANAKGNEHTQHLFYQADENPGLALDDDHDYVMNRVIMIDAPRSDFGITTSIQNPEVKTFAVSQNMPNPFNGTSTVKVALQENANLSLEVINMVGQKVIELNKGAVTAGTHSFLIDASNLESGVYFYNVKVNNQTTTKKMIVK